MSALGPGFRLCVACAALLAVTSACGVRTDPRPPEDTAARAPEDAAAEVRNGAVVLRWERPTKTVDGRRLYDLAYFAVERRAGDGEFEVIVRIDVTDTDRLRTQRVFEYTDTQPSPGRVEYRVRAVHDDGEPGVPSETVAVEVPDAP